MSVNQDFSKQLRAQTAAVRFRQDKFGVRRALSPAQHLAAAETFGAQPKSIHATKQLLDTKAPEFRAVTQVISRARSLWMSLTVPYPEDGVRLIRREKIDGPNGFTSLMEGFENELEEAKTGLRKSYTTLRNEARKTLGDLFSEGDYPPTIDDQFSIEWDFPSLSAPEYLKQLNPDLYAIQEQKLSARFDVAVKMAEEAFVGEFQSLIGQLAERLQPADDGKPKVFRDATVTNLNDFFDRFRNMLSGSNEQLDQLVADAQKIVSGVQADVLRKDTDMRETVSASLAPILASLDGLIVTKPKRKIVFEAVGIGEPTPIPHETPIVDPEDSSPEDSRPDDVIYDTSDSQELDESEAA